MIYTRMKVENHPELLRMLITPPVSTMLNRGFSHNGSMKIELIIANNCLISSPSHPHHTLSMKSMAKKMFNGRYAILRVLFSDVGETVVESAESALDRIPQ